MNRARHPLVSAVGRARRLPLLAILAAMVSAGCGGEPAPEPANPVQQRIDPIRERIMDADSIARERVRELESMDFRE
jgi:hypothetical protein